MRGPRAPLLAYRASSTAQHLGGTEMTVRIAESTAPAIGSTTVISPFPDGDWELEVSITDAPLPAAPDACDTSDGCESSCASSCTSD
ncbi:FxLD family lanthipeptide [Streptomyces asiaticus]|uniref:FxLD family lanthipeptide n=1 Tax=Streptomyces asiaticus TaxID=114695 RepID=UPI00382BBFE0